MSDIVEMLRTPTGCVDPNKWELAAADEIERLRAVVAAFANASQSEATSRLRRMAKAALSHSNGERAIQEAVTCACCGEPAVGKCAGPRS